MKPCGAFNLCLLFLASILSGICSAEEMDAASAIDVEGLINKHIEALGGRDSLEKIYAMKALGKLIQDGFTYPMTIYRQRPNRYRLEWLIDHDTSAIIAYDGEVGWSVNMPVWALNAKERVLLPLARMSEETAELFLEDIADFDGSLINLHNNGGRIEIAPEEKVDGIDVFHLRVRLPSGRVQSWYLNKKTFLVTKKTVRQYANPYQGFYDRHWYYLSHKLVSGITLPYLYEREDIQRVRSYRIESFEINPTIDPSVFSIPESRNANSKR